MAAQQITTLHKVQQTHVKLSSYPQLHTSIAGVYLSSPRSNSGGRYHSVITLLVYGRLDGRTGDKRECLLLSSHTRVKVFVTVCWMLAKKISGSPLFRVIQPSETKVCELYLTSDKRRKVKLEKKRNFAAKR